MVAAAAPPVDADTVAGAAVDLDIAVGAAARLAGAAVDKLVAVESFAADAPAAEDGGNFYAAHDAELAAAELVEAVGVVAVYIAVVVAAAMAAAPVSVAWARVEPAPRASGRDFHKSLAAA